MITTSGGLIKKFADPSATYSPVLNVLYYDTPYSVPSWGMKCVTYNNAKYYGGDGLFHGEEVVDVSNDPTLAHSYGSAGPPVVAGSKHYLQAWYGYFYAEFTGTYKFYCTADDGIRFYLLHDGNGGRTSAVPDDLTSSQLLNLNPVDVNETRSSWARRESLTTYSGWVDLTEGEWYPIKVEYANFGGDGADQNVRGDVLVRYSEPEPDTIFAYGDSSWRYLENDVSEEATFMELAYSDVLFSTGTAPFGTNNTDFGCAVGADINTAWTLNTNLMLRRTFSLTADETTHDLLLYFAVDNDCQVWFNEHLVETAVHDGCPQYDDYVVRIPRSILNVGTNLLAVLATDRGGVSFFDARMMKTKLLNSDNHNSRPDRKKVLSAGIVNYPFNVNWASADDAAFIGPGTPGMYTEMPEVISIDGERGIGVVGQYKIKLPLGNSIYEPIYGAKSHYRHVPSNAVIRPGRLIDIYAGYQTQCRFYTGSSCDLGYPAATAGGYYQPNLCGSVNPKCPGQRPMPGDYVKRFRGRIVDMDIERGREKNFLILTCEDNLTYLQTGISRNFPDPVTYATFDYENKAPGESSPNGIHMPQAYDAFLLSEAIEDVCIKSGIDPTYLYSARTMITSGFDYVEVGDLLEGHGTRLTRPDRYSNPFFYGDASDIKADEPYLWTQSFGEPMIDLESSLADNYGYFFTAGVDGSIIFSTRSNPDFKLASSPEWIVPAAWSRDINSKALGGSYLNSNDTIGHAYVSAVGNRFDLYMGLEHPFAISGWNVLYNEGIRVSGMEHGQWDPSQIASTGQPNSNQFIGVHPYSVGYVDTSNLYSWHWELPTVYKGTTSYYVVSSMYDFNCNRFDIDIGDMYKNIYPGLFEALEDELGAPIWFALDVEMGHNWQLEPYSGLDAGGLTWNTSPTKVIDSTDISWVFDLVPPERISLDFDTDYAMTSGSSVLIKFSTKLMYGASELTPLMQANSIADEDSVVYRNLVSGQYTFMIQVGASPNFTTIDAYKYDHPVTQIALDNSSPMWNSYSSPWGAVVQGQYPSFAFRTFEDVWDNGGTVYDDAAGIPMQNRNYKYERLNYMHINLTDKNQVPSGWFGVRITDLSGGVVFDKAFSNNALTQFVGERRFSGEGVDAYLGYNPSIFRIAGELLGSRIPGTFVGTEAGTYTIYVSGHGVNLEGLAAYSKDIYSSKMYFDSATNMYSLDINQSTKNLRNEVVVVGRLRGYVTEPNTDGAVVNPNNPTSDYVYSKAIDIGSISRLGAVNNVGKTETFVIFEPSIGNQEHADWLSFAVLDRYHKLQNEVSMDALAVPYLDLEDAVTVVDKTKATSTDSGRYWIESIGETIEDSKWSCDLGLTPLPPWPSFVPTPPANILDYRASDTELPQLIVDVQMLDLFDAVRNDAADTPGNAFDPYESEGASVTYHTDQSNVMVLKYRLLVNAGVAIVIRKLDTNAPCTRLFGSIDRFGQDIIYESQVAGEHVFTWDGIDELGQSRDSNEAGIEEIIVPADGDGHFPGIYAHDGYYVVEFHVKSFNYDDHEVRHAPLIYRSDNLPTLSIEGNSINDASLGRVKTETGGERHECLWQLVIGERTKMRVNTSPTINSRPGASPRQSTQLFKFTSSDNFNAFGEGSRYAGAHVWLGPETGLGEPSATAHSNRLLKFKADVDYHYTVILPIEDMYYGDSVHWGVGNNYKMTNTWRWPNAYVYSANTATFNTYGVNEVIGYSDLPSAVLTADGITTTEIKWPEDENGDQLGIYDYGASHKINQIYCIKNTSSHRIGRATIPYQPDFIRSDTIESLIVINPRHPHINHYYDTIPHSVAESIDAYVESLTDTEGWKFASAAWRYFSSPNITWQIHNLVYTAKWYTVVYEVYDKSGRAPTIQQTYDSRVGIGVCNVDDADGAYKNRLVVRCHWIPESDNDLIGGFYSSPKWQNLNTADNDHYALKRFTVPGYTDQGATDLDGTSVDWFALPVVCVDGHAFNHVRSASSAYQITEGMTVGDYEGKYSDFTFFAYPVWAVWKPSLTKASWDQNATGAQARGKITPRGNFSEDPL